MTVFSLPFSPCIERDDDDTSGEGIDDKEDEMVFWSKESLIEWIPPICEKAQST